MSEDVVAQEVRIGDNHHTSRAQRKTSGRETRMLHAVGGRFESREVNALGRCLAQPTQAEEVHFLVRPDWGRHPRVPGAFARNAGRPRQDAAAGVVRDTQRVAQRGAALDSVKQGVAAADRIQVGVSLLRCHGHGRRQHSVDGAAVRRRRRRQGVALYDSPPQPHRQLREQARAE